jgi:hypothetical protein
MLRVNKVLENLVNVGGVRLRPVWRRIRRELACQLAHHRVGEGFRFVRRDPELGCSCTSRIVDRLQVLGRPALVGHHKPLGSAGLYADKPAEQHRHSGCGETRKGRDGGGDHKRIDTHASMSAPS